MTQKRILITEVSGECRNLRIQQDPFDDKPGTYCAAYIHGGWEKIDPKECETCKREKYLTGMAKTDVVEIIAETLFNFTYPSRKWREAKPNLQAIYKQRAAKIINKLIKGGKNANK